MNYLSKLVFLLSTFIFFNSCEQSTDPNKIIKNPLDMTWIADTLAYPGSLQTNMRSIWGSSPENLWICGHNDLSIGNLWHFANNKWQPYDLFKDIGPSSNTLMKVFGFSSTNVWLAGYRIFDEYTPERKTIRRSLILKFDGFKWVDQNLFVNGAMTDIWGKSPNDIWVNGWGITSNYNGVRWQSDTLKYFPNDEKYQLWDMRELNGIMYMTGVQLENVQLRSNYYFYKNINQKWKAIDSFTVSSMTPYYKFGVKLNLSWDNKLFSFGYGGVFEYRNESWINIKTSASRINGFIKINDNYMIAVGDIGQVLYYDGKSWNQIQKLYDTNVIYTDLWTNGYEVYIIGLLATKFPQKTIVWHGK